VNLSPVVPLLPPAKTLKTLTTAAVYPQTEAGRPFFATLRYYPW
jgi:hypothetical protein